MRSALVPTRLVRPGRSPRRTAAALLACGALLFGASEAVIGLAHQPAATTTAAAADSGTATQAATSATSSGTASTAISAGTSASSSSDTSVSAASATPTSATS